MRRFASGSGSHAEQIEKAPGPHDRANRRGVPANVRHGRPEPVTGSAVLHAESPRPEGLHRGHTRRCANRRDRRPSPTSGPMPTCPGRGHRPVPDQRLRHRMIFGLIAVLGAVAWAIIAFFRGETVNAVWFVVAGHLHLRHRLPVLRAADRDEDRPAARRPRHPGGRDLRERHRLSAHRPAGALRHHFAAIAGAARWWVRCWPPRWGHLPGPSDHHRRRGRRLRADYLVLAISTRRRGRSLGQMARDELGAVGGAAAIVGVLVIMVILLAVLALVVVNALAESPWASSPSR